MTMSLRMLLAGLTLLLAGCLGAPEATIAPPAAVEPSAPDAFGEVVAVTARTAAVTQDGVVVATVEEGRRFGVIERGSDLLRIQVCDGTELKRGWIESRHVRVLTDSDVDLCLEALKLARQFDPETDIERCRARLDELTEAIAGPAAAIKRPRDKIDRIGVEMFARQGFAPNDGVNTFAQAIGRKQGDCVWLSLMYLSVARRLDMPVHMVQVPRHVFVRYDDGSTCFNIETTARGVRHISDKFLNKHIGYGQVKQAGGIHLRTLSDPQALGVVFERYASELQAQGRVEEACELLARVIEINPEDSDTYSNWAVALSAMGRHREACRLCEMAVQINPRFAGAYNNWGAALAHMGRRAEACEKFAKAAEIDPYQEEAHYNWGTELVKMGDYARACEKFEKAAGTNGQDARVYLNWGWALLQLGRRDEAVRNIRKAVQLDPRYAPEAERLLQFQNDR